jgi:hypothetical protein
LSPKKKSPPSILLNPAIIRNKVVFPHPEGPSNVKNSPGLMLNDKSGIATNSPYFFTACEIVIPTLIIASAVEGKERLALDSPKPPTRKMQ